MGALATTDGGATPTVQHDQHQYLTFHVGRETFAIGILGIKEIIGNGHAITEVPRMPAFIRGVLNLRGAVVPVIDLGARFGKPPIQPTKRTCIVIVEMRVEETTRVVGVMVDAVDEVLEIPPGQIEPAPAFGAGIRADFIAAMGKLEEGFVIILAIERVFSYEEMTALTRIEAERREC